MSDSLSGMASSTCAPITMHPIGHVVSVRIEPVDDSWGSVTSEIVLRPEFADGLLGLEQFSHALVMFWMDRAHFERSRHLRRRPQGRADMPEIGIFSQRAKARPNPLGVTAVRIVEVLPDRLRVRGLDAINGTPVLDIKPHYRCFDAPADTFEPEWVDRLMTTYF